MAKEDIPDKAVMIVAVILPSLAGGGMERMRLYLIEEWLRRGIAVDLVVTSCKGDLREHIPSGVDVFEVAPQHPALFPIGLFSYLLKRKPSHILSAGPDVNAITLFVAGLFFPNTPVVVSFHNHLSSELGMARGLSALKMRAAVRWLRHVLKSCSGVVAVSHGVADDLNKHFPPHKNKTTVIYNPVITRDFQDKVRAEPHIHLMLDGKPSVIYVGRLTYSKGLDVLMDAFAKLSRQTDAHLVLLGNGPYREEIIRIKEQSEFGERVHVLPYQENSLPYIRNANVLVLPSRHEGLPNVIIEALACGTQVVATNCLSGPSEILAGGRFGQLVPVGDPDALSDALLRSLNGEFFIDPEELRQRGLSFSAVRAADQYLSVLMSRGRDK